ncbi:MAG: hypothetical protein EB023_02360 [Flavobacteriia bacterium]|nr:hypothetical protein [Flavobacteriia bacterium]
MIAKTIGLYFKRIKLGKLLPPKLMEIPFRDIYYMSHGDGETSQYINGVATFEVLKADKDAPLRYVDSDNVWASSPLGAYEVDMEDDLQRKLVRQAVEQDDKIWKTAKALAKIKKLL